VRTLIVSLGNPLCGDDGAGPRVIERLAREPLPAHVELKDMQAPGIDLLLHLDGVDTLIVVDACATADEPGTVIELDKEGLFSLRLEPRSSPHQPSLLETLRLARTLASEPRAIHLIGIAARSFDLGTPLSLAVEAAVEPAARAVLALIADQTGMR